MTEGQLKALGAAVGALNKIAENCKSVDEYAAWAQGISGRLSGISPISDMRFFCEIGSLLVVMADIISDPYLTPKSEHDVILAATARSLSPRDFSMTVRDSALWRRKGKVMLPERVHVTAFEHEIENAENFFVARVMRTVSSMLGEYAAVYAAAAKSIGRDGTLTENSEAFIQAYFRLNYLIKKLGRLMDTRFYRRLSSSSARSDGVEPTNVLCHEPRYRKCYKFYLRRNISADKSPVCDMLAAYFSSLMAARLKGLGFRLLSEERDRKLTAYNAFSSPVRFISDEFEITLTANCSDGFAKVDVFNRAFGRSAFNPARGIVLFTGETDFEGAAQRNTHGAVTVAAISPCGYARLDEGASFVGGLQDEVQIVGRYLADRMTCAKAQEEIYSHLCPNCKGTSVTEDDGLYVCADCGTRYAFSRGRMWIVRRGIEKERGGKVI